MRKSIGKVKENDANPRGKARHRKSRRKICQGSGGASAFRKVKGDHSEKWRKIMTRR